VVAAGKPRFEEVERRDDAYTSVKPSPRKGNWFHCLHEGETLSGGKRGEGSTQTSFPSPLEDYKQSRNTPRTKSGKRETRTESGQRPAKAPI